MDGELANYYGRFAALVDGEWDGFPVVCGLSLPVVTHPIPLPLTVVGRIIGINY